MTIESESAPSSDITDSVAEYLREWPGTIVIGRILIASLFNPVGYATKYLGIFNVDLRSGFLAGADSFLCASFHAFVIISGLLLVADGHRRRHVGRMGGFPVSGYVSAVVSSYWIKGPMALTRKKPATNSVLDQRGLLHSGLGLFRRLLLNGTNRLQEILSLLRPLFLYFFHFLLCPITVLLGGS
jgi:hypothetical protein